MGAARLRAKLALRTRLGRLRYRLLLRRLAGRRLLRVFAEAYPRAIFVEIGANDGDKDDVLRTHVLRPGWRGVMVEPVPYLFERLSANYAGVAGIAVENAAVADRDGTQPFFHIAPAPEGELPYWYDEIGSFSRDFVLRHAPEIPDIEERLVETEVETLTFASLCERHGLDHVDVVMVDAEGYDAEIVRAFPFARFHPRVLVYEHFHMSRAERAELRALVAAHGYESLEEGMNTFCLDTRPDDALTRRWRRLRPVVPAAAKGDG